MAYSISGFRDAGNPEFEAKGTGGIVTQLTTRLRQAWDEDLASGASFYVGRTRLDDVTSNELRALDVELQADFISQLPLPTVGADDLPYFEFDDETESAESIFSVATMFSLTQSLAEQPAISPLCFGLLIDRPWPDSWTSYFWSEWEALVARLGADLRSSQTEAVCALVHNCEWAAAAATIQLNTDPEVVKACLSRTTWFDSTARHVTRGMLLLNEGVSQETFSLLLREHEPLNWYWAVQRLPWEEDPGDGILDIFKWESVTNLCVASPVIVAPIALQRFADAAVTQYRTNPQCFLSIDENFDATLSVFGILAQQPGLNDGTLRELAELDEGAYAGRVAANPGASLETRVFAQLNSP